MRRSAPGPPANASGSIARSGNLVLAVAHGGNVPTIVAEMEKREERKAEIDRVLRQPTVDRDGLHRALEAKLEVWKRRPQIFGRASGLKRRYRSAGGAINARPTGMTFNHLTDGEFEELTYDLLHALGFVNLDWRRGSGKGGAKADQGRD